VIAKILNSFSNHRKEVMENGRKERQLRLRVYWTKAGQSQSHPQSHKRQKQAQEVQIRHGYLGRKKGGMGK
jgi:hypothetical protein